LARACVGREWQVLGLCRLVTYWYGSVRGCDLDRSARGLPKRFAG
jgi:hypothetical protein